MKFNQTSTGTWKSEQEVYSAAMLAGEKREPIGIKESKFIIKEGEYKGNTVYRLYEQHIGRKEFLKRFKTLEDAIKFASKEA